jgi:hypothetical protein
MRISLPSWKRLGAKYKLVELLIVSSISYHQGSARRSLIQDDIRWLEEAVGLVRLAGYVQPLVFRLEITSCLGRPERLQ